MSGLFPTPQLDNYYLHYTSREGAQGIIAAGCIRPGRSARIYATRDLYPFGEDAANHLAITSKVVEMVCFIHQDIMGFMEEGSPVEPIRDGAGRLIRHGGGTEFFTAQVLVVTAEKERWLSLMNPCSTPVALTARGNA